MSSGRQEAAKSEVAEPSNQKVSSGNRAIISADDLRPLRDSKFDRPLEELTELLSQTKRVFLVGAGCSKCAGLPLMEDLTARVLDSVNSSGEGEKATKILQEIIAQYDEAEGCTIEDYMSELVDLLSIAERRASRAADTASITVGEQTYHAEELRQTLGVIKASIAQTIGENPVRIQSHCAFVRAVHLRLQQGKTASLEPVDYFTLNYDTLLEDALSLERVPLADGFSGGTTAWWRLETLSDPSVRARVLKVHGSIDWILDDGERLPRRIRSGLQPVNPSESVLIWPAATKYREAQSDPFAQVLDVLRRVLRPMPKREVVLAILGYSFGDSHINHELDRAIRDADGRLTVLVFKGDEDPQGLIKQWCEDPSTRDQVRLHAKGGFFHAGESIKSSVALPWWKFEILGRLLAGER